MSKDKIAFQYVQEERFQGHGTRRKLYEILEKEIGMPVVSFFTSFVYPVGIEDSDASMIEGILQKTDLSKGLTLIMSSPGGSGLSAERIINVCREYSKNGKYQVVIPNKAKSAATMICLGAEKLIMSCASELGPIDPQKTEKRDNQAKWFSVFNIVKSYEKIFSEAVKTKGNLQPYIQQLNYYDPREIEEMKSALSLSEDIAVKTLKSGMLKKLSIKQINKKIETFLIPEKKTKTHGRPIYAPDAKKCGLNIKIIDPRDKLWQTIYELYIRLNSFVSTNNIAKCIENKSFSFHGSIGKN